MTGCHFVSACHIFMGGKCNAQRNLFPTSRGKAPAPNPCRVERIQENKCICQEFKDQIQDLMKTLNKIQKLMATYILMMIRIQHILILQLKIQLKEIVLYILVLLALMELLTLMVLNSNPKEFMN